MSIFSDRIRQLRLDLKKTQPQVCSEIGFENISSPQVLNNYEKGNRTPNIETIVNMASYYNVSTDYLLGKSDHKNAINANIRDRLGLSDAAIKFLENIYRTKKDNSLTRALNDLVVMDNGNTLINIAKYLYYRLRKDSNASFVLEYNGESSTYPLGFDIASNIDSTVDYTVVGFIDEERLKKITLFEIMSGVESLYKKLKNEVK